MDAGGQLHARLQDAGRVLLTAARAHGASTVQHMILPEPTVATAAFKGEAYGC